MPRIPPSSSCYSSSFFCSYNTPPIVTKKGGLFELTQRWVGGVGGTETCINHNFHGIFFVENFQLIHGKCSKSEGFGRLTQKKRFWRLSYFDLKSLLYCLLGANHLSSSFPSNPFTAIYICLLFCLFNIIPDNRI